MFQAIAHFSVNLLSLAAISTIIFLLLDAARVVFVSLVMFLAPVLEYGALKAVAKISPTGTAGSQKGQGKGFGNIGMSDLGQLQVGYGQSKGKGFDKGKKDAGKGKVADGKGKAKGATN